MSIKIIYHCDNITGGIDSTYLDYADGNSLSEGDRAYVIAASVFYLYRLNATSGAAESSPNVISPDTNAGTKRWILITSYSLTAVTTGVTQPDNTSSTLLATTAFAKSQDAVLHRDPDQGVALTAAASGSSGITVADNDNIDFGTGNFALVWKGSLPDWTIITALFDKRHSTSTGVDFYNGSTGLLRVFFGDGTGYETKDASIVHGLVNGTIAELVAVYDSVSRTVAFYKNGVALGVVSSALSRAVDVSNAQMIEVLGSEASKRHAGTVHHAYTLNFAPTAAEVLDMYRNSVPLKWFDPTGVSPASQTAQTSGSLVIGKEYVIDTWNTDDDFTNVGAASNANSVRFVATGATPTKWLASSSLRRIGATLMLTGDGMQPVPGQILDNSGNKLHARYPATGAELTRRKKDFEIRWINTWAGSHEAQYLGGLNQAILPIGCYITNIIGVITGGTINDIIIGDGSDTDHWVTITTGLAAGTVAFTVAIPISDGTNFKLIVDPDANFTGSISWVIKGIIL